MYKAKGAYKIYLTVIAFIFFASAAYFYWQWHKVNLNKKVKGESSSQAAICSDTSLNNDNPSNSESTTNTNASPSEAPIVTDNSNNNPLDTPINGIGCLHKNISTTYFWVGEDASKDNKNISNSPSAWDEAWVKHFGGVDDPKKRNGFSPAGFTPKENPFYFALPYNDFDNKGNCKKEVVSLVPWAKDKTTSGLQSVCKNRWIKIIKGSTVAYAQWEDVGPFKEDDSGYVFGTADPKSKTNDHAGLDVSPAVRDYLKLSDVDKVDWQFIDASAVPDGPWKKIITTSQVYWK